MPRRARVTIREPPRPAPRRPATWIGSYRIHPRDVITVVLGIGFGEGRAFGAAGVPYEDIDRPVLRRRAGNPRADRRGIGYVGHNESGGVA